VSAVSPRLTNLRAAREPVDHSGWILPVIALAIVVGSSIYISVADLDDIEARVLAPEEIMINFLDHVRLVLASTVIVIFVGIPLGIILSRRWARSFRTVVLASANAGQAIPSIGILVLLALVFGIGFNMAVIALVLYALLPVLRNTLVGLQQVDQAVIDAGRGMGMSPLNLLTKVELPLAVPVILAGVRIALILNVGVATIATFTNGGGLGNLIERGIALNRMPILLVGSLLTIALALVVDWVASIVERKIRPKGL